MKKYILLLTALFITGTTTFGFATIVTTIKGGDKVTFDSNVQNVLVLQNSVRVGMIKDTPFTYKVKRSKRDQVFTFRKDGYKDVSITLQKKQDVMYWGNFLIGGLVGSTTDKFLTANEMQYSPRHYFVEMQRNSE